jgi:hypothetical protein
MYRWLDEVRVDGGLFELRFCRLAWSSIRFIVTREIVCQNHGCTRVSLGNVRSIAALFINDSLHEGAIGARRSTGCASIRVEAVRDVELLQSTASSNLAVYQNEAGTRDTNAKRTCGSSNEVGVCLDGGASRVELLCSIFETFDSTNCKCLLTILPISGLTAICGGSKSHPTCRYAPSKNPNCCGVEAKFALALTTYLMRGQS